MMIPLRQSVFICSLTCLLVQAANCTQIDSDQQQADSKSPELARELDSSLFEAEPRQYFRLHSISSPSRGNSSASYKRIQLSSLKKRRQTGEGNGKQQQLQKLNKLKKLSNKAFIKSINGSSIDSLKNSNFKFVFIQRAPPQSNHHSNSTENNKNRKDSLAASVSKQLANSLLNSAANIVINMTAPSLSSLLNAQSLSSSSSTTTTATATATKVHQAPSTNDSSNKDETLIQTESSQDSKRVQTELPKTANTSKTNKQAQQQSSKATNKFKRPSKIYNLPVKFVSNGQPNSLMFNTIKQHFATIKKLQMASLGSTKLINSNYNYQSSSGSKKKLRPKLKGNSRLIYLPLSYLSNAKPLTGSRLLTKATHKSTTTKTSAS